MPIKTDTALRVKMEEIGMNILLRKILCMQKDRDQSFAGRLKIGLMIRDAGYSPKCDFIMLLLLDIPDP